MIKAVLWGILFGLCTFGINIILPGCLEPWVDFVILAFAVWMVVRHSEMHVRRDRVRFGLISGIMAGVVISLGDLLMAGFMAMGYVYRDKIPWLNLPDHSYLNPIFGNTLLALIPLFLCIAGIRWVMVVLGGVAGGWPGAGKQKPSI